MGNAQSCSSPSTSPSAMRENCAVRAILSHPFSGAMYWWFTDLVGHPLASENPPTHPYYAALFATARRDIDVALACAVIFDDVILPAVDAPFPDTPGFSGSGNVGPLAIH